MSPCWSAPPIRGNESSVRFSHSHPTPTVRGSGVNERRRRSAPICAPTVTPPSGPSPIAAKVGPPRKTIGSRSWAFHSIEGVPTKARVSQMKPPMNPSSGICQCTTETPSEAESVGDKGREMRTSYAGSTNRHGPPTGAIQAIPNSVDAPPARSTTGTRGANPAANRQAPFHAPPSVRNAMSARIASNRDKAARAPTPYDAEHVAPRSLSSRLPGTRWSTVRLRARCGARSATHRRRDRSVLADSRRSESCWHPAIASVTSRSRRTKTPPHPPRTHPPRKSFLLHRSHRSTSWVPPSPTTRRGVRSKHQILVARTVWGTTGRPRLGMPQHGPFRSLLDRGRDGHQGQRRDLGRLVVSDGHFGTCQVEG